MTSGRRDGESARERVLREAAEREEVLATQRRQCVHDDYVYDKAQEKYWDIEDGTLHGAEAVDASIPRELWRVETNPEAAPAAEEGEEAPRRGRGRPRARERLVPPSFDIRRIENNRFVESSTWWPGMPRIVHDFLIDERGAFPAPGRRAFNTFRPVPRPEAAEGDAAPWIAHIRKLWPEEAEHEYFFNCCAHMVQRPFEKCNAAIVLSGAQGIGKDAALAPIRKAVGEWNARNIDPDDLFSPYRPWLQTLMLIIDEVRPQKEDHRASAMYNILKPLVASPPETLPLNDKYVRLRHVLNLARVFITTNDWLALFIPEGDRRMFIANSLLPKGWHVAEGRATYFADYWAWLGAGGGARAVARWLWERDISSFSPNEQPPRTAAWSEIADSWAAADDGITAALAELGDAKVIFGSQLRDLESSSFDHREEIGAYLRQPRKLAHRMLQAGYSMCGPLNGAKVWEFRGPKGRIQTRHAFVRRDAATTMSQIQHLIASEGRRLVGSEEAASVTNLDEVRKGKG